ncbi:MULTISPECIES: lipoprotein-releasing ABC transporter permease subunit [Gammaproteobacteria]|uniref:lipoprotein-releasing ABC transporter permease subunit n=1 Tax=Gammaproteobacteria TaxID=1236 RepID=UPI000DCFBB53|nr:MULTISPECIES: lipoprotein-releasing ABC transporter permease subunit [Gammaproteobacteria]RTE86940.1 lipoprotein-releasing ABC transporter permease subunit [Aliidiomarina sp. B3213]TCZ93270.1 lipoprotein-releasing ABC transporter permease subunit [Lysobacter sp. N42]
MFQPAELFIALRYSRSKRKKGFAAFIRRVSTFGITLGVMALIVVSSVMNGFEHELKARILGLVPHVTISQADTGRLENWQSTAQAVEFPAQVQAWSPFLSADGLVQGTQNMQPVRLQGVFPDLEPPQSILQSSMVQGRLTNLEPGEYGIVLGRSLANQLNVWIGDSVRVMAAEGQRYTLLGAIPAQRNFTVVGLFSAGSEVDQQIIFLHGEDARRLFRYEPEQVTAIRLYLKDAFAAPAVVEQLNQAFAEAEMSGMSVQGWEKRYGRLFSAVKMEKTMMMVMLTLVVIVAAFNAISALVMLVQDKRGDIAVLQTLGMTPHRIYRTLMLQGVYTGGVGATVGLVLGLLITVSLNPILTAVGVSIFGQGEALPYDFQIVQILTIFGLAIVLTLLATIYPAFRAAQIRPAEILRHE